MPELPEVETVRRAIEPILLSQRIETIRFHRMDLRFIIPKRSLKSIAKSGAVQAVNRHGKYLLIQFPGGDWIVHLGMSGNFHFSKEGIKHVHVEIHTKAGSLYYSDPRRFGFFDAIKQNSPNPHLDGKGPDAWLQPPDEESMFSMTRKSRTSIKSWLLNQKYISGIGNIYACEILYVARVSPRKMAGRLNRKQCAALAKAIPDIMNVAIEHCGTTFDSFRTPEGQSGDHYQVLNVYEREGQACKYCASVIRRIVQSNRSTYFCPDCQTA